MATVQYISLPNDPSLATLHGAFPHPKRSVIFGGGTQSHRAPALLQPTVLGLLAPIESRSPVHLSSSTAQPVAPHSRVCLTIPSPEDRRSKSSSLTSSHYGLPLELLRVL